MKKYITDEILRKLQDKYKHVELNFAWDKDKLRGIIIDGKYYYIDFEKDAIDYLSGKDGEPDEKDIIDLLSGCISLFVKKKK